MFDFIKRNAELENLPYMVATPKKLAEVRHRRTGLRYVQITGHVEQMAQFIAPMAKLVEERKVSVCSRASEVNLGRNLVKSPRLYGLTAKTKSIKAKDIGQMIAAEHFGLKG